MTNDIDNNPAVKTARRAWQCLADAHLDGDFSAYLDMLTDDYTFCLPVGEFREQTIGKHRAAECYRQIAAANPKLKFDEPLRISASGNTVVIEFEDAGTNMGFPYRNRITSSFDVRGEQICGYREYFGYLDLEMLINMAQSSETKKESK